MTPFPFDPPRAPAADPLRWCIFTTIGLLAWLLTPAAVVLVFSAVGLVAYGRALRQGHKTTRCYLRDTRLVLLYLLTAFAAGAYFTTRALVA